MPAPPSTIITPGGVSSQGAQAQYAPFQMVFTGVDTAGNGPIINTQGFNGAITLEIVKSGTGTCDVEFEHTMDPAAEAGQNSPWEDDRYNALGVAGVLTPAAGVISLASGSVVQGIALLDYYPTRRVSVENVSGTVSVQVRIALVPQ